MAGDERRRIRPAHRRLTEEDERVWVQVARTAKPLRKDRAAEKHRASEPVPVQASAKPKPVDPTPRKAEPRISSPAPHAAVDRRSARQIATGRLPIDARLDLHGLRQSQAHGQLRSFLARAQELGARNVLIITGKGVAADAGSERGVLRRAVPVWLTEHPLNLIVIGWQPAHRTHGGEGALYVRLRRTR